jgi:hypothetical protein
VTLAQALADPRAALSLIAVLIAGERLIAWSGSGPWTAALEHGAGAIVAGVEVDGAELAAEGWSWASDGTVTLEAEAVDDPEAHTIVARLEFLAGRGLPGIGRGAQVLEGVLYPAELLEAPRVEFRVGDVFGSVEQIGSGSLAVPAGWPEESDTFAWREVILELGPGET